MHNYINYKVLRAVMVRIFFKSYKYIDELRKSCKITRQPDKRKVELLFSTYERLRKARRKYVFVRGLFYVALYAAVVSSLLSVFNVIFLSKLFDFIFTVFGIIGTTFALIMIVALTILIRNYDRDLSTIESHIISIYVKYDTADAKTFEQMIKKIR